MVLVKKIRKPITINSKYLNKKEKNISKSKSVRLVSVIRVSLTKNNTKLTLLDRKGNIRASMTKGSLVDFKGYERRLPMASMTLSKNFARTMVVKNKVKKRQNVRLILSGSRRKKRVVVRGLRNSRLNIKSITNIFKKKFNGCTKKKKRRL